MEGMSIVHLEPVPPWSRAERLVREIVPQKIFFKDGGEYSLMLAMIQLFSKEVNRG